MAKSAGQLGLSAIRNSDRCAAIRKRLNFTEEQRTVIRRQSSRKYLKNSSIAVAVSIVAMPVTGGASFFALVPSLFALFDSSIHTISAHVETA